MRVEITKPFNDKFNLAREFTPGEVLDFEQARAEDIVSRGLGKFYTEEKPKVEAPKEEEPEKETPEVVIEPNEEPKEESEDSPEEAPKETPEPYVEKKRPGRKRKTE